MVSVLFLTAFVFTLAYVLLMGLYRIGWARIKTEPTGLPDPAERPFLSVVVAARNEEAVIGLLLQDLLAQDYPSDRYEVIVVDDHSEDDTAKRVCSFSDTRLRLIRLAEIQSGSVVPSLKKAAITRGVQESRGLLIVTTDADCRMGPHWLSEIGAAYQRFHPTLLIMPVVLQHRPTPGGIFQMLDFMALQGITGASWSLRLHGMANGANLAYERSAFLEAGGYTGNEHIPSGDDMMLLHTLAMRKNTRIRYLLSHNVKVQTPAVDSWSGFWQQRIRWSSKAASYRDNSVSRVLLLVFLTNLFLLLTLLGSAISPGILAIASWGKISLFTAALGLLMMKTLAELVFLWPVAHFFNKRAYLILFPFFQPLHLVYTVVCGMLGAFGTYTWKGRRIAPARHTAPSSLTGRLFRIRSSRLGLSLLMLFTTLAVFCYWLAPDATPGANRQAVELQGKPPGHQQLFLKRPLADTPHTSVVQGLLGGVRDRYEYIPISEYHIEGDRLQVRRYLDEDTSQALSFSIPHLTAGHPENITQLLTTQTYWLGTDALGRDMLSRLMVGARVSLSVGGIALLVALTLGILLGALGGYYGGRVDAVVMWLLQVTWSIPTLLMVIAFTVVIGKGFWLVFVAVGLTMWVSVARMVRSQMMVLRNREFVQAARTMGFSDLRIILRHLLPNMTGPLVVVSTGIFASAILIEAGLSFLGMGVQPPYPSWGLMIKENYTFLLTGRAFMALVPGLAVMLLVWALHLVGHGLREAMDVRETGA